VFELTKQLPLPLVVFPEEVHHFIPMSIRKFGVLPYLRWRRPVLGDRVKAEGAACRGIEAVYDQSCIDLTERTELPAHKIAFMPTERRNRDGDCIMAYVATDWSILGGHVQSVADGPAVGACVLISAAAIHSVLPGFLGPEFKDAKTEVKIDKVASPVHSFDSAIKAILTTYPKASTPVEIIYERGKTRTTTEESKTILKESVIYFSIRYKNANGFEFLHLASDNTVNVHVHHRHAAAARYT
jgi:hypothetical protein